MNEETQVQTEVPTEEKPSNSKKKILIAAGVLVALIAVLAVILINGGKEKPLTTAQLLDLGEKYLLELDYEQAIVAFEKLIEIEPKNERAYTGAAEAYIGIGDTEKAIAVLQQGLAQMPGNAAITDMLNALLPPPEPEPVAAEEEEILPEIIEEETNVSDMAREVFEQAQIAFDSKDIIPLRLF